MNQRRKHRSFSPLREEHAPFFADVERERVEVYTSRPVRDRVFRRVVLEAYDCRCAITGLKFINGGGRAEVQAAHIKPVEHHRPDVITNASRLVAPRTGCSIAA